MQALRILMLLVTLAIGYVLFFRSQPQASSLPPDLTRPVGTAAVTVGPTPRTEYKEAMNRAQAVAKQMQAERKEADSD